MEKLFLIVREDIPVPDQAVQNCHAISSFMVEHPKAFMEWTTTSNTLALLAVPNETELMKLMDKAQERGILGSGFREPDMGNQLTAIALEPAAKRLCRGLPKAFQEINTSRL